MTLPDLSFLSFTNILSIVTVTFLGITTIILSSREEKMRKHLVEKEKELRLREDFMHMMVHDLRSPLTSIKDASELVLSSRKLDKSEQTKFLRLVEEQSKTMLTSVSSILDAAKIQAGRFTIQKVPGDIKKTVQESIQVFMPQAKTKNIKLETEFDKNLPLLSFDPIRIGEVINNLLSNSLKFTPEKGKITISVNRSKEKNNHITISVADTGMGIAKEKQDKLFSKFSQIVQEKDNTEQSENLGTGLGLYITKGIIEAHGGSIFMNSELGQGTTISFTLPVR